MPDCLRESALRVIFSPRLVLSAKLGNNSDIKSRYYPALFFSSIEVEYFDFSSGG